MLFASAIIDYDYIMNLIADYTSQPTDKQTMNRKELLGLIAADAKFMDEHEDIKAYIATLKAGVPLDEKAIREGYAKFKQEANTAVIANMAKKHGLAEDDLQKLVDTTLRLLRFDGDALATLMQPLNLGWKERSKKEVAIMEDLAPFLRKQAKEQDISGLSSYET